MIKNIEQWFKDRDLDKGDPTKQMVKLMEEVGELAEGIAKDRPIQIKDSIGDAAVVLIGLALQSGTTFNECLEFAYNEIKDRKGKVVNGIFIKDEV